jgi:hypothetical protein
MSIEDARRNRSQFTPCPNRVDYKLWGINEILTQGEDDKPLSTYAQDASGNIIPETGFEPYQFLFNSVYKDGSSNLSNGIVSFAIGDLNSGQSIKNIVKLRASSFWMPRVTFPATSPDAFFFLRIYLSMTTFSGNQSVLASQSRRFQFEYAVGNVNGTGVELVPVQDSFVFKQPILSMTGVQFQFLMPPFLRPMPLPSDTMQVQAVPGSNPGTFNLIVPGDSTAAIGPLGALAAPGVALYNEDFQSTDSVVNNAVTYIGGFYATNNTSLTQFQTNLDFTTLTTPAVCTIIIAKNRIAFVMEATCVTDHETNYVKLVQD